MIIKLALTITTPSCLISRVRHQPLRILRQILASRVTSLRSAYLPWISLLKRWGSHSRMLARWSLDSARQGSWVNLVVPERLILLMVVLWPEATVIMVAAHSSLAIRSMLLAPQLLALCARQLRLQKSTLALKTCRLDSGTWPKRPPSSLMKVVKRCKGKPQFAFSQR